MAQLQLTPLANAQARLVLNGGFIRISNGAHLVIDNANPNAISRTAGHIISEGENNILRWNIGTETGNYSVPFGYGNTDYLPTAFTPSNGIGNGSYLLSTYYGGSAQNSNYLPNGVSNYNYLGNDNSTKGIDRFWEVNAVGYNTKPTLSNLQFTYRDVEHNQAPNLIVEGNLQALRWNDVLNEWTDYLPTSTVNTTTNTVTLPLLAPAQQFTWWTMMSFATPLPVVLKDFTITCVEGHAQLQWQTTNERNNKQFDIEYSINGMDWSTVKIVEGNGNTSTVQHYQEVTPITTKGFFRLLQQDIDGKKSYSYVMPFHGCNEDEFRISLSPNPTSNGVFVTLNESNVHYELFDVTGKQVARGTLSETGFIDMQTLAPSHYMLRLYQHNTFLQQFKISKY